MKTVLEWINQKWFWILISFLVTIFIHIGLQYYFWDWSLEAFNNTITPIASLISVVLFFYLTLRQLKLSESLSVAPYFEAELKRIENITRNEERRMIEVSMEELSERIANLYILHHNAEFKDDYEAFKNGVIRSADYFNQKLYYNELRPIHLSLMLGVPGLALILNFLDEIEASKLNTEARIFLKNRIRNEVIRDFMFAMDFLSHSKVPCMIPAMVNSGEMKFILFTETEIGQQYSMLAGRLGIVSTFS